MEIWAVEGVAHCILPYLDLSTFDAVLDFIQAAPELHGYLQDGALWTELSHLHFGGRRDPLLQVEVVLSPQDRGRQWSWTSRDRTCVELQHFLQSLDDRRRFHESVTIVDGDIQHVTDIDGAPLDAIVFPTNPHLTNHHVGAAAAVFRRAGPGLEAFVRDPAFRGARPVGSAVVTPGFDAGCYPSLVASTLHLQQ
ncbi:Macro domain-containing protein [Phytophthora cinnamomi]|uniref:Macro domain-containing protein n=1 Tax=Phytophthora cinnamomi TaxID=4785 RepID=UPI00355A5AA3|nr:Macro domain-containing protein [Phytophthora cinnamomi]